MPPWQDAVQDAPGGVRLLLDVTPGAKQARFPDGFEPWRVRLGMRVRAAAQDGAANADVVRTLADFFGQPTAGIAIESGATDRRKVVRVSGLDRASALVALAPYLEGGTGGGA